MKSLLIDVGSTSIKWAESENGVLGEVFKTPFPQKKPLNQPLFEVSIKEITEIIKSVIDGSAANKVLFSVQMHGYLLADKKGKLLTDYISWQDRRATLVDYKERLSSRHGVGVKPNLPRASVYATQKLKLIGWNAEQFFTLGSYLAYFFTGKNITHVTDAAPSGYYDAVTGAPDSCNLILPTATMGIEVAGKYNGKEIYTPVGDQQASVFGAGGEETHYILNLGTAAQACAISPVFVDGEFESRPYFFGKTLCTVTGLMGGKFISENVKAPDIAQKLTKNYLEAIKKLPKRSGLFVTGGTLKYHGEMLGIVFNNLGLKAELNEKTDALEGLKKLSEKII